MYFAHSANDAGQRHELKAHLEATAVRARHFAEAFEGGELAYWAGLWHDLGKFSDDFQRYIGAPEKLRGPVHSTAGAVWAEQHGLGGLGFLIAGHHGGLPDKQSLGERLALTRNTKEPQHRLVQEALKRAANELSGLAPLSRPLLPVDMSRTGVEMYLRMLFSALVDADFLDTEEHFNPTRSEERVGECDMRGLWDQFELDQQRFNGKDGEVNRIRHEVYRHCLAAASQAQGFFRLTVPTGGGKTRSSMAFALRHALAHNLRRVVVAIPYTSIIDQTAEVYRDIFRKDTVLEHHSQVDWLQAFTFQERKNPQAVEPRAELDETRWSSLASENWDASIVVTTTVQLFESLFSNRPSACRKLHNLARSVLILDEVQTLPPPLLEPILDALKELVASYRVTVVLCSATLPAFNEAEVGRSALQDAHEIVPEYPKHFELLRRVRYELQKGDEPWTWQDVAERMRREERCMAVLNTKKDSLVLLEALDDPNAVYLSTYLCGVHRRHVLAEVKERLKQKQPCRLVTTQVVEAGVDLDFPAVFRAMGPLDRIVQAAGRCNREGELPDMGRVTVFEPAEGSLPHGAYRSATDLARQILRPGTVPDNPTPLREYFRKFFPTQELDGKKIQELRALLNFPEVSRRFRLIDDTEPVVVRYQPDREHVEELLVQARRKDMGFSPRRLFRNLQPYMVNVWRNEVASLEGQGLIQPVRPGLWEWLGHYDEVRGVGGEQKGMEAERLVV